MHKVSKIISILIISIILSSCSSTSNNGNLSDAMEKASDKNKGSRKITKKHSNSYSEKDENEDSGIISGIIDILFSSHNSNEKLRISDTIKPSLSRNSSNFVDAKSALLRTNSDSINILSYKQQNSGSHFSNNYSLNNYPNVIDKCNIPNSWLAFYAGSGTVKSDDFFGLFQFGLNYDYYFDNQNAMSIGMEFSHSNIQNTSKLNYSIRDGILLIDFLGEYKHFTTPKYTFIGHYFIMGAGISILSWDYKHTIQVPEEDEYTGKITYKSVTSDNIAGFDLHIGMGLNIIQFDHLRLGSELIAGTKGWFGKTTEGFNNDTFDPITYAKINFKLYIGF